MQPQVGLERLAGIGAERDRREPGPAPHPEHVGDRRRDQGRAEDGVHPVAQQRPAAHEARPEGDPAAELAGRWIGLPDLRDVVRGEQLGERPGVDLVGLDLGLGDGPGPERVGHHDPARVGRQDVGDRPGVPRRLEDHLVVGPEGRRERLQRVAPDLEPAERAGPARLVDERDLAGMAAEVETDRACHRRPPTPLVLVATPAWAHDTYGSALRAQPGESQGRPHTTAGSWPIGIPACPQLVSDTGPLSRFPKGMPGSTALVHVFHSRYDAEGRLLVATETGSGDRLEATYDAAGHRTQIQEVTAGVLTRTRDLRYAGDAIVEETVTDAAHPSGAVVRTYTVTESGQVVSMTIPAGEPSAGTYLVTWNGHGDALALWRQNADGTLTLANSATYGTWGTPAIATHNGIGDLGFRFLYVGAADVEWDDFSGAGLLYMHARHYSPLTGRFLQPDPSAAEANLYGYAGNSPVTKVDPSGLDPSCRAVPGWWAFACDLSVSGYVLLAPIFTFVFGWLILGPSSNSSVIHLSPRGARIVDTMCAVGTKGCLMMAAGAKRVDLQREIERTGWKLKRTTGDHDVYTKPGSPNITFRGIGKSRPVELPRFRGQ